MLNKYSDFYLNSDIYMVFVHFKELALIRGIRTKRKGFGDPNRSTQILTNRNGKTNPAVGTTTHHLKNCKSICIYNNT